MAPGLISGSNSELRAIAGCCSLIACVLASSPILISAGNTVLSGVTLEPAHDGVEAFGSLLSQTWSPSGAINGTHEMTDTPSRLGQRPLPWQRNSLTCLSHHVLS